MMSINLNKNKQKKSKKKKKQNTMFRNYWGVPVQAQQKRIRQGTMRFGVRSLASIGGWRISCCYELWCRPLATAPIQPLAWESPYTAGAALKSKKKESTEHNPWPIIRQLYGFLFLFIAFCLFGFGFLFVCFLGPNLRHVEFPRLGV